MVVFVQFGARLWDGLQPQSEPSEETHRGSQIANTLTSGCNVSHFEADRV